jgi:fumarate hydratase class I
MSTSVNIPVSDKTIRTLHIGDDVLLNGVVVTGRDMAHQWMYERFIRKSIAPTREDLQIYSKLKTLLNGRLIYHCGPIVRKISNGEYEFISAGPTTSLREESFQADIMRHFNLKGVIGKGGMGEKTLQACAEVPAVYFHAVGGAAALIARSVEKVLGVHKLEFGIPEAMWIIQVKDFPAVVTMDAYGKSLHQEINDRSQSKLETII